MGKTVPNGFVWQKCPEKQGKIDNAVSEAFRRVVVRDACA
jgi:hypothetical protein